MRVIENSIDIARPPEAVFAHVSDMRTEADRKPAATTITLVSPGPVALGSRFDMDARGQGPLPSLNPTGAAATRDRFTNSERDDQIARRHAKGSRDGRPPSSDTGVYAGRIVVERCFNRLKQFRDLASRYAERAAYFRAEIILAAAILLTPARLAGYPVERLARPGRAGLTRASQLDRCPILHAAFSIRPNGPTLGQVITAT
ncbi:hypothetical protein GCM10023215_01050 [Pseudonocardia yuanmonensis]|uniref:Transposase DDE domain-containing protein n=1 Tax=Pseudonocardia yuanmonensis TaxID=1095914 RepID=A0ABP8VW14_9PSEU